jgi:hypothetical protein
MLDLYLLAHPDRLIDKQTLMKAVWPDVVVEEKQSQPEHLGHPSCAPGDAGGEPHHHDDPRPRVPVRGGG